MDNDAGSNIKILINANNKKICYLPWISMSILPNGEFRPCCKYKKSLASSFNEYNIEVKKLQTQFLNGEQPKECDRCWRDENNGIESKRQYTNQRWLNDQPPTSLNLHLLDFSFGNTCNLACRTCNSTSSSRWLIDEKKVKDIIPVRLSTHNKFYKDNNFVNQLKGLITKDIKVIEFVGGETFISGIDEQIDFLKYLLDKNPQNTTLRYITNLTEFPKKEFWDFWKYFKMVDIQLSIDGIEDKFEYIRYPANWEQCLENLNRYQDNIQPNMRFSVSHTVSIFNVFYVPKFIYWCLKNKLPKPHLGLVDFPDYFSIQALNPKTKKELSMIKGMPTEIVNDLLKNNVNNTKILDNTLKHVKIIDELRNQKFSDTFPEYFDLLRKTCPILSQLY